MNHLRTSGVYCLHCISTEKKYIGASTDINKRLSGHKSASKTSNLPLYEDIRTYGWDNIIIGIVEEESDIDKLNQKEDYYIHKYDTINNGYNSNNSQPVPNEEIKKRMSESHKGRTHSNEARRKMSDSHKGKVMSDESRQRISKSNKGKVLSPKTKDRMSEAKKGKTHSEETRRKLSELKRHTHIIHNRITDTTIDVMNLQEWCSNNGINYQTIMKTISKGRYTKSGYRIISSTKD